MLWSPFFWNRVHLTCTPSFLVILNHFLKLSVVFPTTMQKEADGSSARTTWKKSLLFVSVWKLLLLHYWTGLNIYRVQRVFLLSWLILWNSLLFYPLYRSCYCFSIGNSVLGCKLWQWGTLLYVEESRYNAYCCKIFMCS